MQNVLAYFAYGSNLNLKQMKDRCPGSKPLIPATLKGYRLTERKYADIDPSPGSSVHGVMCHLTKEDLDNLDVYEGYPRFYTRILVDVETIEVILTIIYVVIASVILATSLLFFVFQIFQVLFLVDGIRGLAHGCRRR